MPTGSRFLTFALLALAVLITRLPFLGAGYGWHADNWRIALAARHIAETGVYEYSRAPGFPVQDYVCSWFWKTGPYGFNGLDTFFCIAAALFFAAICREYGCRDWWLAGLALAFVPIVYVNSVSSKDFPWALAFLLAAWWCAMRHRPFWTGVLLGLAIGVRITSGVAALPIALILVEGQDNRRALRTIAMAGGVSAAIALAAFTPVYWRYGFSFLDYYPDHVVPPGLMASRATVEVWGLLGGIGVLLALLSAFFQRAEKRPAVPRRHLLAWALTIGVYYIAFFALPDEGAYLIPAVPFILLLAWYAAPPVAFRIACVLVLLSSFFGGWNAQGLVPGDILKDHIDRVSTLQDIRGFLRFSAMASGSNAYIAGSWQPPIAVLTEDHPPPNTKFFYLVTRPELEQLRAHGWSVWYLPLMREFDARVYGFDVARYGARDVRELRTSAPPP